MSRIITFFDTDGNPMGRWHRQEDGSITADGGATSILDTTLKRMKSHGASGGWGLRSETIVTDEDEAWAFYKSWSNGYTSSLETTAATLQEAMDAQRRRDAGALDDESPGS